MILLWLARHGVTEWTRQKRYQGYSDRPLNAEGATQAEQLAARLASEKLHAVISSDLQRALTTAQHVADEHKLAVQPEPRLRESNFGIFEGLRYKDVIAQYPAAAEAWFANPEQPPAGGECLSELGVRVQGILDQVVAQYDRKRVLLVGHNGSLRVLLCLLLGMPIAEYWRFNLDPCALTQVNIYPGGAILIRLNDDHHLKGVT